MADIDELKKKLEDGWIKGEPYVFVSYASKDKEKVYEFVYELRKRGINVYIDIELQENISKNWLQNIKERLYDVDCVAMISFLSLNYFRSYACLIEQLVTRSEDLKILRIFILHWMIICLQYKKWKMQCMIIQLQKKVRVWQ